MPTPPEYFFPRQESSFDAGVRKALNGQPLTSDADFEQIAANLSAEQCKTLFDKASRSDKEKADQQRARENADAFIKLRPEVRDTTQNAYQLRAHCMSAFGTPYPSLEMLDKAYQSLRANNLLDLNKAELGRQADAAATSRAKSIREEAFDEASCDGMDLEQIRYLANKQMGRL
jgi:hypothetical protein